MMNDLEDRVRQVMAASVADAEPGFTLADVRRGYRRRRARLAAAAVVTAAAAVLAAVLVPWPSAGSLLSSGPVAPAPGRFVDPVYGWSIRYPRGVVVGSFSDQGRDVAEGVRVTTFAPDLSARGTGIPDMGWLRDFPAGGVAVQI